ncbi:hypothetical protein JCM10207_003953 [Rhodosporidiobolus poonsookiae]
MSPTDSKIMVCVTGASGFIGSAVALLFLEQGHRVRLPLRSQAQIDAWRNEYRQYGDRLQPVLLQGDITAKGTFDEVVKECEAVVHTASPALISFETSAEEEILKPALSGTLSMLESCRNAPSVKSVVITSSVAAYLHDGVKVLTEDTWNPTTFEEAAEATEGRAVYAASKALAEKAAFDFLSREKPSFALSTVAPARVLGRNPAPGIRTMADTRSSFGSTVKRLWDKSEAPPMDGSAAQPDCFVSITDVARAHVSAALSPAVPAGKGARYLLLESRATWADLIRCMVEQRPELGGHLPPSEGVEEGEKVEYRFEAGRAGRDFGFEYEPFETYAKAFGEQVYELAKTGGEL